MNFSKLAVIREKWDLSQREISNILKVSKSTYARWETGEQIIPLNHLNDFCFHFKVTMDYVLGLDKINKISINDYKRKLNTKKIGNNIKIIRRKNKLTQQDLANLLNTSQSTICAYENGKNLVLTIFLYNIAVKFNYSFDKLCDRRKIKENISI